MAGPRWVDEEMSTSRVCLDCNTIATRAPGLPTRPARVPTMVRPRYVPDLLPQSCSPHGYVPPCPQIPTSEMLEPEQQVISGTHSGEHDVHDRHRRCPRNRCARSALDTVRPSVLRAFTDLLDQPCPCRAHPLERPPDPARGPSSYKRGSFVQSRQAVLRIGGRLLVALACVRPTGRRAPCSSSAMECGRCECGVRGSCIHER